MNFPREWGWAVVCTLAFSIAPSMRAQQAEQAPADNLAVASAAPVAPATPPIDKRAFGVLPNYRLAELSTPFEPISAKRKFYIGTKDTFDTPVFFTSAFFSGVAHLQNQNPSFGQGAKGYAHRYALGYVDQVIGNYLVESIVPSALHLDPRYWRKGEGSTGGRLLWAVSRIFVTRTDRGNWTFNANEWLGTGAGVAISNLYYPETRTAHQNVGRLSFQVSFDAANNVLKEFWPDIKQKLAARHKHQP